MEYPNDWEEKVFQSSHVHSGKYSPSRRTLILRYGNRDQKEYEYAFPPHLWERMKTSESPGRFVSEVIRANFPGKIIMGKKEKKR